MVFPENDGSCVEQFPGGFAVPKEEDKGEVTEFYFRINPKELTPLQRAQKIRSELEFQMRKAGWPEREINATLAFLRINLENFRSV